MASFAQQKSVVRSGSLRAFVEDEAGLSTTEYVIILALIAVGAIAAWRGFGASVRAKVNTGAGEVASLEGVGGGSSGGGGSLGGGVSSGDNSGGSGGSGSGGSMGGSGGGGGAGSGGWSAGSGASGAGGSGVASAHGAGGGGVAGSAGGAAGAGASGGAGGANAAARSNSNVSTGGATDVDRANEQLDQQEQQALKERRMIAFGVALLCLLSLIGLAVYNTIRAKKIREEALKQKELAAKQASYAVAGMSSASAPPPVVGGGGGGGSSSDSLADITIPPPPKA
jgi:Flp pilus assembly pilin Flp